MRVDIIIENNAYQSYIFDYSISDYDKINMMLSSRHNNRHVAWWHVLVDYMKSNKPAMMFKPTDVLTVNFENELLENTFKAYLDGLSGKVKFKTYSNIVPWLSMLQEYWLDTNWNKKKKLIETKKTKKTTSSFSGSGSVASGISRNRINPLRPAPAPTVTIRADWVEQVLDDMRAEDIPSQDDEWLDIVENDAIQATVPVVPEPTSDATAPPLRNQGNTIAEDDYVWMQRRMFQEWQRISNQNSIWTNGRI